MGLLLQGRRYDKAARGGRRVGKVSEGRRRDYEREIKGVLDDR